MSHYPSYKEKGRTFRIGTTCKGRYDLRDWKPHLDFSYYIHYPHLSNKGVFINIVTLLNENIYPTTYHQIKVQFIKRNPFTPYLI